MKFTSKTDQAVEYFFSLSLALPSKIQSRIRLVLLAPLSVGLSKRLRLAIYHAFRVIYFAFHEGG